jgi:murein DD-endopeptidase MepM/ murein hydrolase activator NlpD
MDTRRYLPKLPSFPSLSWPIVGDIRQFFLFLRHYFRLRSYKWFVRFELFKDVIVDLLYKKRGKYVRPFLHFGTIGLVFVVITAGPVVFSQSDDEGGREAVGGVLSSTAYGSSFYTQQAEEVRMYRAGEIIIHAVSEGETLSSIAERYGLEVSTIIWENELPDNAVLRLGAELRILPVDGVRHRVTRGETIQSIGKRYGLEGSQLQAIVDYPFNEFLNDENFDLAIGQFLMVPDGVPPRKVTPLSPPAAQPRRVAAPLTPDAGSVNAVGSFVWPASGQISQGYRVYHRAIDIANRGGGPILASDGGVVISAGWPDNSGYGNRVVIDHQNGFVTLYAHLSVVQVQNGQRVNRGDVVGQMGSTGRSTGVHLHFEIRRGGVFLNPLDYL